MFFIIRLNIYEKFIDTKELKHSSKIKKNTHRKTLLYPFVKSKTFISKQVVNIFTFVINKLHTATLSIYYKTSSGSNEAWNIKTKCVEVQPPLL